MSQIKIDSAEIKEGMMYSAPVFFDDGKNMFLPGKKPVREFHLRALKRWNIPFLLTSGTLMAETDTPIVADDLESLDEVEEFEMLEDLEELEEL